jgi:ribonuclease HII
MNPPVNLKRERKLWQEKQIVVGVDEAGRGPLAGPVVAAAVILPADFKLPGLDDSKKLSAQKREQFFEVIVKKALAFGVGIVENTEIDRINIHQASLKAMGLAISKLKIKPHQVFVDGRHKIPLEYLSVEVKQLTIIGGDRKSASIAAASVIAKVTRDRIMQKIHVELPMYGFDRHKGYGTKSHYAALKKHGVSKWHRLSFNLAQ